MAIPTFMNPMGLSQSPPSIELISGEVVKFGTLWINGVKQLRPTRPWVGTPAGAPGAGNMYYSSAGTIQIKNTDSDDDYKLQWVVVVDGTKTLLICDRCLTVDSTFNTLNANTGNAGSNPPSIIVDGIKFTHRFLDVGTDMRIAGDNNSGATPTGNEWDRIILNEGGFPELPVPTASDLSVTTAEAQRIDTHNQLWNWYKVYTWGRNVDAATGRNRLIRGNIGARYFYTYGATTNLATGGYRPVLELE